MPNIALLEILGAILLRVALFFSCRKFLLRTLYHDLQSLSSDELQSGGYERVDSDFELDGLPTPAAAIQINDSPKVTRHNSLHSVLARTLFSACFSESCTMFLMLMAQGFAVFRAKARMLNWSISLFFLLANILVIIPVSLGVVLTVGSSSSDPSRRRSISTRMILCVVSVLLYLYLLSCIPLPDALSSSDFTTSALSRLVVLGTIILGLLSGFGAISNAWAFFPLFSRNRTITTKGDILNAEQSLSTVREDLRKRRMTLQKHDTTKPHLNPTWLSRIVPTLRNDASSEMSQEIRGLETLEIQMARNFEALKEQHEYANFSGTFKGQLFNWGGQLFAIYCIFRVISSILNILSPSKNQASNYPDIITHFIAYLLLLVPSIDMRIEDIAVISRQISLGLVGVIILSSMRLVLRGVTRALRVTSRNLGASLMLLILAQLMGIYILSTIVQLRTSFPPPPPRPDVDPADVNLFSTIPEYQLFGFLFDMSFLVAAGLTAFGRWMAERVNGLQDHG